LGHWGSPTLESIVLLRVLLSIEHENGIKWELKMEQLAFAPICSNHSGANVSKILIENIDKYGICMKLGWFAVDNATNNDTAIETVANSIDPLGEKWKPIEHQVR
jgi:hypothetical protein